MELVDPFVEVCDLLNTLQAAKGRRYGDAYCKHGEAISIFGNVARKFDRLAKIIPDAVHGRQPLPEPTSEESVAETVGDLAVYAVLWLTYLKTHRPDEYAAWKARIGASVC